MKLLLLYTVRNSLQGIQEDKHWMCNIHSKEAWVDKMQDLSVCVVPANKCEFGTAL